MRWFGSALAVTLALAAAVALAASSDLRERAKATVGIRAIGDRIAGLVPAPGFTVFQPAALPDGMRLVTRAYKPGRTESGHAAPVAVSSTRRVAGKDAESAVEATAARRLDQLSGHPSEARLVLIYAAGPDAWIELVQRSAAGEALPTGDRGTVRGVPAVVARRDGRDVVTWIEQGTSVELSTTLGRAETLRIASSLQPTTPEAFGVTEDEAGDSFVLPPSAAWQSMPLSQRVGLVEVPNVARQDVARRCGPWDADLHRTASMSGFVQARCAARLVAGMADESGASGLDRSGWRQAAERLGLDPFTGPGDDPPVYLVQVGVSERGGNAVVLDAADGTPYLLVKLKPAP